VTRATAALLAVGFGLVLVACYLVMVRTSWGQAADLATFRVIYGQIPGGWPASLVTEFARAAVVVVLAAVALVLGAAAVGRGAWGALASSLLIVGASTLAGPWLRDDVLVRPPFTDEAFPQNSMPSTHAVAATALVVAVLVLWPAPRPWWLVNVAAVVLLLVAVGNIESQAHRPSDVAASFLLVGTVAALTFAVVGPPRRRR